MGPEKRQQQAKDAQFYQIEMAEEIVKIATVGQLAALLNELIRKEHNVMTKLIGTTAMMHATFRVLNKKLGGFDQIQKQQIGYDMIGLFLEIRGPIRLLAFEDMLSVGKEEEFAPTMPKTVWKFIQTRANELLKIDNESEDKNAGPELKAHWESIVAGKVPYGYTVGEG